MISRNLRGTRLPGALALLLLHTACSGGDVGESGLLSASGSATDGETGDSGGSTGRDETSTGSGSASASGTTSTSSTSGTSTGTGESSSSGETGSAGDTGSSDESGVTGETGTESTGTSTSSGDDTGAETGTDTSASQCGDGTIQAQEECDTLDLGGLDCLDQGFVSGILTCAPDCTFDTSACSLCGNNTADDNEECDGTDLGALVTCADFGLGTVDEALLCTLNCTYDLSQCSGCGDGLVLQPEECEGDDMAGQTCQTQNYDGGDLLCGNDCRYDYVECFVCGDGIKNGDEECDQFDFGGLSCPDFDSAAAMPFEGGDLNCSAECMIDTDACTDCGDGEITGDEVCDGSNLDGEDCASQGFTSGTLLCTDSCDDYDVGMCTACGDGMVSGVESCDCGGDACTPAELDDQTCTSRGFDSGALACTNQCLFDETGCVSATCGDGAINGNDQCDCGADTCTAGELANQDCPDFDAPNGFPFHGGTLACNDGMGESCSFNTDACTWCGDTVRNGPEDCDEVDFDGATCESEGFAAGGTLGCNLSCEFVFTGCNSCGNGVLDSGEDCDGGNLDGATCVSRGFGGGTLSCNSNCTYNTSACTNCGNGTVNAGEQCDCGSDGSCTAAELSNKTCAQVGFSTGTLGCNANCTYNTSMCMGSACNSDSPAPGGSCPAICNGGCNGTTKTCNISCGSTSCNNVTKTCPAGWNCNVSCGNISDCANLVVACPADYGCTLACTGINSCANADLNCSSNGICRANCTGIDTCTNLDVTCGNDACIATCGGASDQPDMICGTSCNCDPC